MNESPGEHPEPPGDLAAREPLLLETPAGAILHRLHARGRDPLFFGRTGRNRFDSPDLSFGVLYAGLDAYCAFIETYGQATGVRTVSETAIEGRHLTHLELMRTIRLIDLSSSGGLARVGADARLFSGSHALAQRWSAAFRDHPTKPDGILYPARHDAARDACAIYECSSSVFKLHKRGSPLEQQHATLLGAILDCYGFALTP